MSGMSVFLKMDDIAGESQDARHPGEIEVTSWTFGVSTSGATHMGGVAVAGKASFSVLTVTKRIDVATPALLMAAANGKHIRTATLSVTKAGAEPLELLVIVLEDVVLTSCVLAGSAEADGSDGSNGGRPAESVALSFGTITVTYRHQLPNGQVAPPSQFAWDVARNRSPEPH